jgi:citrate lyase subunit gamma (acyl carrier protein)
MNKAMAGTMESSDCMMTVMKKPGIHIQIESIVYKQFGKEIHRVIEETLKKHQIKDIFVHCQDKGALDYTIEARLVTALKRLGEIDA